MSEFICCFVDKPELEFSSGWGANFISANTPQNAALAFVGQYTDKTEVTEFVKVSRRRKEPDQNGNLYDHWFFEMSRTWRITKYL